MRQRWNKEIVLDKIREMIRRGQSLKTSDVMKYNNPLFLASRKYIGIWRVAMNEVGVDYNLISPRKPRNFWNKKLIISKILERKKRGLDLHATTVEKSEKELYYAAFRYFGKNGWLKALSLAGLDPKHETKIGFTKEEVITAICTLYFRAPSIRYGDLNHNGYCALVHSAVHLFGSWKNAVEAAGFNYEDVVGHKIWNRQKLVEEIQRLNDQNINLSPAFIGSYRRDLFASAVAYFGNWSQALDATGIDYRLHYKTWSSKAWLRRLSKEDADKVIEQGRKQSQKRRTNQ